MNNFLFQAINGLNKIGVDVITEDGQLRELIDILNDLSNAWSNMSKEEKQEAVDSLIGFSMSFGSQLFGDIGVSTPDSNSKKIH